MKLSRIGRVSMALVVSVAMGLGMTACGGGTVGFMWVLGTQYNQISGFKIDDYTGNLTDMPHQPFTSGGANPVSLVVKPGGRYLYVINEGVTPTSGNGSGTLSCGTGGGIAEFSIGGDGILTFQQCFSSQGSLPVWAQMDSTGSFLYVLDQQAPGTDCASATPTNCHGDITVFSIADDTGRLTLVPNQQIKNADGTQLTYFPVGGTPIMMQAVTGANCLLTVDSADQTIFPYTIGTAGQLTLPTNTTITTGAGRLTSINSHGSTVYLTDAAPTADSPGGYILPYTVGSGCSLNTVTGGKIANLAQTANPVYSVVDSTGKYLYVANQSSSNSNAPAYSSISAYTIDQTTGKLQMLPDTSGSNPYQVGAGPVCMVEDPSSQYLYTSNNVDGTVTGFNLDKTSGQLSNLRRGSKFTATGLATCLAVSGNVN